MGKDSSLDGACERIDDKNNNHRTTVKPEMVLLTTEIFLQSITVTEVGYI